MQVCGVLSFAKCGCDIFYCYAENDRFKGAAATEADMPNTSLVAVGELCLPERIDFRIIGNRHLKL